MIFYAIVGWCLISDFKFPFAGWDSALMLAIGEHRGSGTCRYGYHKHYIIACIIPYIYNRKYYRYPYVQ